MPFQAQHAVSEQQIAAAYDRIEADLASHNRTGQPELDEIFSLYSAIKLLEPRKFGALEQ